MDPALAGIILAGLFGVGIWQWYSSRTQRIRRAMRRAPRTSVRDLTEGVVVRIVGHIADGQTMASPLGDKPCVYYCVIVERPGGRAQMGDYVEWFREERGIDFVIDDSTGRVLIESEQHASAQLDDEREQFFASRKASTTTDAMRALLQRHGQSSRGRFLEKDLSYRERTVCVGATIAVLGRVVREPKSGTLRIRGTPELPLLISDESRLLR